MMEAGPSCDLHCGWTVPNAMDLRGNTQGQTVETTSRTDNLRCDTDRTYRLIQEERLQDRVQTQQCDLYRLMG